MANTEQTQPAQQNQAVLVSIDRDNQGWLIEQQLYSDWPQAQQQLAQYPKTQAFVIAADQQAQVQPLLQLLAWLQSEQRTEVQLLTEPG